MRVNSWSARNGTARLATGPSSCVTNFGDISHDAAGMALQEKLAQALEVTIHCCLMSLSLL